jgi:Zn-dependent peptidase ImmA (M78 family)
MVRSDLTEFERLEEWQSWWARHNIVDSVEGGVFPDLYIRRWGDLVEISVGSTVAPGTPTHFRYQNVNLAGRASVKSVASAVYDVLTRAVEELARRRPGSERIRNLSRALADLMDVDGQRYNKRLAYLSGANPDSDAALEEFTGLWRQVDEILGDVDPIAKEMAIGRAETGLVLETTPQVALLFGSYSPEISDDDVHVLVRNLHNVLGQARTTELPDIKVPALPALSPGQEGSQLGEAIYRELVDPNATFVDIEAILRRLNITYSLDELSDRSTRAVSLLSENFGIHMVVNRNYLRGVSERVLRFTLAHELGHILFDRDRSLRLAVVSGPWAPQAIEKRANAFAAAFLMPEELLDRLSKQLKRPLRERRAAEAVASHLRVSLSSLADRMYNLLLVTREEADDILYGNRRYGDQAV